MKHSSLVCTFLLVVASFAAGQNNCSQMSAPIISDISLPSANPCAAGGAQLQSFTETITYNMECLTAFPGDVGSVYFTATVPVTGNGQCEQTLFSTLACPPHIVAILTPSSTGTGVNTFDGVATDSAASDPVLPTCTPQSFRTTHTTRTCNALSCPSSPPPPPPPICDPCLCGNSVGTSTTATDPTANTVGHVCSPVIVDLSGKGFNLTNAAGGVRFDISGTGHPIQIAWTAPGNDNGFLFLDRNGNGVVDGGNELFGNFTPQPQSSRPNGFLALAEFDKPANGGNGDGVIDARDAVFGKLRVWVDANHDGISQPNELFTLSEVGIVSISLDYSVSSRTDPNGNIFRYRSKINQGVSGKTADVGKKAFDVFLVTE